MLLDPVVLQFAFVVDQRATELAGPFHAKRSSNSILGLTISIRFLAQVNWLSARPRCGRCNLFELLPFARFVGVTGYICRRPHLVDVEVRLCSQCRRKQFLEFVHVDSNFACV